MEMDSKITGKPIPEGKLDSIQNMLQSNTDENKAIALSTHVIFRQDV